MGLSPGIVNKHKRKLLNIVVLIISLIIAYNIFKSQSLKAASLEQKKETEMKKNEVLAEINKLENKVDSYKKFINRKDIPSVINTINNIAKDSMVKIVSIKPQPNRDDNPDYTVYSFSLAVNAEDYHALGRFIAKLESSGDLYGVDSLNIRELSEGARGAKQAEGIAAELVLSTFLMK